MQQDRPPKRPCPEGQQNRIVERHKTQNNMTTLDLNAYGGTEMSHAEKVAENGGSIIAIACAAITIL